MNLTAGPKMFMIVAVLMAFGCQTGNFVSDPEEWEAVSTYVVHMCGILKADRSLLCKGAPDTPEGQLDPPGGAYIALQTSSHHSCALSIQGEVRCWGSDDSEVISQAPSGLGFTKISVGNNNACALDEDGQANCWGHLPEGILPTLRYTDLVNTMSNICGTPEEGGTICILEEDTPPSRLHHMRGFAGNFCGLTESGSGWCDNRVSSEIVAEVWVDISPGGAADGCALSADGEVACWGYEPLAVPLELKDGRYISVHNSDAFTCALREEDSVLVCWGDNQMDGRPVSELPHIWEM